MRAEPLTPDARAAAEAEFAGWGDGAFLLRALVARGAPAVLVRGERGARQAAAAVERGVVVVHAATDPTRDAASARALAAAALTLAAGATRGADGPVAHAAVARAALGLPPADAAEVLYARDLADAPPPARARQADDALLPTLALWRADYCAEIAGRPLTALVRERCARDAARALAEGRWFVALDGDAPAACARLGASVGDAAEVAGVWTPPDRRGRGHARDAVRAVLAAARARGARRAVLYADRRNAAARRSYERVGFAPVADHAGDHWGAFMHDLFADGDARDW